MVFRLARSVSEVTMIFALLEYTIDHSMSFALSLLLRMSFALVEFIPIYDSVSGHGSVFKPELKAMTSASILFTIFLFGGATFYLLNSLGFSKGNVPNMAEEGEFLLGARSAKMSPMRSDDDSSHSASHGNIDLTAVRHRIVTGDLPR